MIVIGEKLNSSIPSVNAAYQAGDTAFIQQTAIRQLDAGADYLDVNAATFLDEEVTKLRWAIDAVLSVRKANFMVDSPAPAAIDTILSEKGFGDVIINSITLESNRLNGVLPLIAKYRAKIVALPISDAGIPQTAEERFENAAQLIEILTENGAAQTDIFLDALFQAIGAEYESGAVTLETIRKLRAHYPEIHIIGGLSNISFGLPKRTVLNSAFLSAAIACGLDSAIMDITNRDIRLHLAAARVVTGQDEYCIDYLETYRELYPEE